MTKLTVSPSKPTNIDVDGTYLLDFVSGDAIINVSAKVRLLSIHSKGNYKGSLLVNLINKDADVDFKEVAITSGKETFVKKVRLEHVEYKTFSNYKFFGVAMDDSELRINAISHIGNKMPKSEAHQILRIISSDNAVVEGQPSLLIDNYDVKASHGNSIGQLSSKDLYYLQTKGIDKSEAKWMLLKGQIAEITDYLEDDSILDYLRKKIID